MNDEKRTDQDLPRGFESGPVEATAFKAAEMNRDKNRVNFHGPGRGGPPGRPGQVFEKPKAGKATVGRLIKYFGREKMLLIFLIAAVLAVTVASLIAPML